MANKNPPVAESDAPPAPKKKGSSKKAPPQAEPGASAPDGASAPEGAPEPKAEAKDKAAAKTKAKAKAEPKAKAKAEPKAEPKPSVPEAQAQPAAPEPEPEPEPAAPEPEPEPPVVFARESDARSDEDDKAIRSLLKRGEKALEAIEEVLASFDPAPERAVKNALKRLAEELDSLKPPEPRKCKEYKRALALARRGEMGIHPDDIMKYCRCEECFALREKAALAHPPAPKPI